MSADEIASEIERRMSNGEPFTFGELHRKFEADEAYRIADRAIQKWRRKGWIEFTREGRDTVWRLTEAAPYGKSS